MTEEEMLREIARLKAENAKLEQKNTELHFHMQKKLAKAFKENPDIFKVIGPGGPWLQDKS